MKGNRWEQPPVKPASRLLGHFARDHSGPLAHREPLAQTLSVANLLLDWLIDLDMTHNIYTYNTDIYLASLKNGYYQSVL